MAHILKCVPEGYRLTTKPMEWMTAVRTALADQRRRADFCASVEKSLRYILTARIWEQPFTTSPSWKKDDLAAYGIKRATFHRVWRWLIDNKLLGWVAWGRQHDYKPANLKAMESEDGDDKAVYVMAVPENVDQGEASVATASSPVDISETLTPSGVAFSSYPTHGREDNTDVDGAPRRLKSTWRGFAALAHRLLPALPVLPRGDMTAKASKNKRATRESQEQFAVTLKHFIPALNARNITDKHLAAVLRQQGFFTAGWTVNDIRYALDRRPDGTRWNHDGANGVGNLAKWLAYRLEPWRDEHGWPVQSPYQRQRTEQAEARAQAQLSAHRRAERERLRVNALVSGAAAAGIAQLRAAIGK